MGCCLSYKDTILKANHSRTTGGMLERKAVAYPTKILFWKRITAHYPNHTYFCGCCLSYKDTILKANHSQEEVEAYDYTAVAYPTKILFWKRITAFLKLEKQLILLLLILQRYYFESESQPHTVCIYQENCCCLSYKDTILKANHSRCLLCIIRYEAVAYPTKILFWKRITAPRTSPALLARLLLILQRYYFESESQRGQIQNKIQPAVAYPTKILFWKRITASNSIVILVGWLLLILQRYYFESESQQIYGSINWTVCCCLSYKDTILKANHS